MRTCPCGYKWSSARALGQQYVRYTAHISSWYESDDTETEVLHVCCHKEAWISPFSLAVTKELSLHPTSSVPHLTVFSFPSLSLRSQSSYTTHSIPLLILCFMEILLLPFSFLLASHAPMKWPCCNSIDFSSVFVWNPISTALRGISSSPPELERANSLSWGHFSLHFIYLLSSFSSPSTSTLFSFEHTEIEQAWLMQHLSQPNVSFAQPFYTWLPFEPYKTASELSDHYIIINAWFFLYMSLISKEITKGIRDQINIWV